MAVARREGYGGGKGRRIVERRPKPMMKMQMMSPWGSPLPNQKLRVSNRTMKARKK